MAAHHPVNQTSSCNLFTVMPSHNRGRFQHLSTSSSTFVAGKMQEIRGAASPSNLFSPSGSNGDFFTTMWSEATKSLDTKSGSRAKKSWRRFPWFFHRNFPLTWDLNCQINRVGVRVRGIMRYHEVSWGIMRYHEVSWGIKMLWNWNSITNSGLMVVDELMVWLTSQRLGGIPSYPCCSSSGSGLPMFAMLLEDFSVSFSCWFWNVEKNWALQVWCRGELRWRCVPFCHVPFCHLLAYFLPMWAMIFETMGNIKSMGISGS